jgi:hypothetical protein
MRADANKGRAARAVRRRRRPYAIGPAQAPAATASLQIGQQIVDRLVPRFI